MSVRRTSAWVIRRLAGDSGLQRAKHVDRRWRRSVIAALDVEGRTTTRPPRAERPVVDPETRRARLIERLGQRDLSASVNQEDLKWASPDPHVPHPHPPASRHQLLEELHSILEPRTYFEIGVRHGGSLTLSRTRTIGVDPAYAIKRPVQCDLRTFLETSDDFFARDDAFEHFEGTGIDLAFIDGMHMSEYVLRDFIATEARMAPGGVVVLDDVLPRNHLEAYRIRRTGPWSGDVFKVLSVLQTHRPDLTVVPINTSPTGTLLVAGLDPTNTALADAYPDIEPTLTTPDPQTVPADLLHRTAAVDPRDLLGSDVLTRAVALRDKDGTTADFAALYAELNDLPRYGD